MESIHPEFPTSMQQQAELNDLVKNTLREAVYIEHIAVERLINLKEKRMGKEEAIKGRLGNMNESVSEKEFQEEMRVEKVRYELVREAMEEKRYLIDKAKEVTGMDDTEFKKRVADIRQADKEFKGKMDENLKLDREIKDMFRLYCFDEELMGKKVETEGDIDGISEEEVFTRITRICEVDSEYSKEVDTEQRKYRMVKAAVLKENGNIDNAGVTIAT